MKCLYLLLLFAIVEIAAVPTVDEMHVCTLATRKNAKLNTFLRSCKYYNIDVDILALGGIYYGGGTKLTYLKNYIRDLPNDNIVLLVDSYDLVFLADKQTILNKFLEKNTWLWLSTQNSCWPDQYNVIKDLYPVAPTQFRYLNGGAYMGYVGYLKKMLEEVSPIVEKRSEQKVLHRYYLEHLDEIVLDYYCELSYSMTYIPEEDTQINVEDHSVTCLSTGINPCMAHGNGNAKGRYQAICDLLYPIESK